MLRADFDRLLADNPLNDGLLQVMEDVSPAAKTAEPDTPQAVGRIEFLGTNGMVGESVEYTDAERFIVAIKYENWVGTPMPHYFIHWHEATTWCLIQCI